jgi:hypothetical protein
VRACQGEGRKVLESEKEEEICQKDESEKTKVEAK